MSKKIKQAVILAGGRGERLRPFTDYAPKPLFPINGVPFINRLLRQVADFGIKDVVLLLGYRAQQVIDEVGDGSKFGIVVRYDVMPEEFDTAQRLQHSNILLKNEFLLMYCDNYCPIDFERLCKDYNENKALIQLSVYANKDHYTKDNLLVDNGQVQIYDKKRVTPYLQGVDIGYAIVNKSSLNMVAQERSFARIYPKLVHIEKLYATVTEHRYYSIGGYERLSLTEEFFKEKKWYFLIETVH